jgi:hypothetical protein
MRDSNAQFLTVIRTRSHVPLKRTALLSALTGMRLRPRKRDHPLAAQVNGAVRDRPDHTATSGYLVKTSLNRTSNSEDVRVPTLTEGGVTKSDKWANLLVD